MVDYEIKELTPELFVHTSGLLETFENLSPTGKQTPEETLALLKRMNAQNGHLFVAITPSKEIVGVTTLLIEQKITHNGGACGHIEDVTTRKGHEKQGIASAVLKKALSYAKEQGCYKVILDCKELVPFYERFGMYVQGAGMRINYS